MTKPIEELSVEELRERVKVYEEEAKVREELNKLTLDEKRNLSEIAALKGDRMEQLKAQRKLVEELIELDNQGFAQGSEQQAEFEKRKKAQTQKESKEKHNFSRLLCWLVLL